ncbi:uncharacterized protein L201_007695 [Kwoniella dendrophila CBS 6074]|uniref:BAG domain-containing protein n=1 Tax=Kwoniella dendrophila CBS 6074 TaxID=1295534 RepID=A0AAX4K532_9TREE
MPNWVTDNSSLANPNSNSIEQLLPVEPISNNDTLPTELPIPQSEKGVIDLTASPEKPATPSMNGHSEAQGLPQAQGSSSDNILLSPDTPNDSTSDDLTTNTQHNSPSSTTQPQSQPNKTTTQPNPPQQQTNLLSYFGSNAPPESSSTINTADVSKGNQSVTINQNNQSNGFGTMRSVSSGNLQNGFKAYNGPQQNSSSNIQAPHSTAGYGSGSSVNVIKHHTNPAVNLYSFKVKGGQIVMLPIAVEYAEKRYKFLVRSTNTEQVLSTWAILNNSSSYLTLQELEAAIKDPNILLNIGRSLFEGPNATNVQWINHLTSQQVPRPYGQQQQQQLQPNQQQQSPQQASTSRPQSFIAKNGYSYVSQQNPAQIQQSIVDLQNQPRPSSWQSGLSNGSNIPNSGTLAQSPTIGLGILEPPPEVQAIQQEWNRDIQGVEQMFGQAWEQMRTASNTVFNKISAAVIASKTSSSGDSNQLRAKVTELENKIQNLNSSLLRLTESESQARAELQKLITGNPAAANDKIKVQQQNQILLTRLAKTEEDLRQSQANHNTQAAKVLELTSTLQVEIGKTSKLETDHQKKTENLIAQHNAEIRAIKQQSADALAKATAPVFGATGPKSPKSPSDPATEIGKLRGLLKSNNAKFKELDEKYNQELEDLKSQLGKDPKEIERELRIKIDKANDGKVQRLEKRMRELETELETEKGQQKAIPEEYEPMKAALKRIVLWGESIQKKPPGVSDQDSPTNETFAHEFTEKTLLERANNLATNVISIAKKMKMEAVEKREKITKLEGEVELLKVRLTAAESAQATISSSSITELDELKSALTKILTWGANIQVLMGKDIDSNDNTDAKPSEKADRFQKSMQNVFEEIRSKDQSNEPNEAKVEELKEKITELEKNLQANLNALLSKSTQYDDTLKLLEENKNNLSKVEQTLKEKDEELIKIKEEVKGKDEELKAKEEELKSRQQSIQSMMDDMRTEYEVDERKTTKDVEEITKQKDDLVSERDSLKSQVDRQTEDIQTLKRDVESEREKVELAETQMREAMDNQFKQWENKNETEQELKDIKEQRKKLKEEVTKLQSEIDALKKTIKDFKDEDDIQIVSGLGSTANSSINRLKSSSSNLTPNRSGSNTPSQASAAKPSSSSKLQAPKPPVASQATPPISQKRSNGTPLFFANEEEDEAQTPSKTGNSSEVKRPAKKRKLIADDEDDEDTPGPDISVVSQAASISDSMQSVPTHKPVANEWIRQKVKMLTLRSGNRIRCKLCFSEEKKKKSPEEAKKFKFEDIYPLPLGFTESQIFEHVKSHTVTLRRLRDKRVKEGKETASPEPE